MHAEGLQVPRLLRRPRAAGRLLAGFAVVSAAVLPIRTAPALTPTSVQQEQRGIQVLRQEVQRSAARLAAATAVWEREQAELGRVLSVKVSASRAIAALEVRTEAARRNTASFAATLYRNPIDPMLLALANGNARAVADVTALRHVLGRAQQERQDDVDLLQHHTERLQALVREQDEAARQSHELQASLNAKLVQLQAESRSNLQRLQRALAELHRKEASAALAQSARETGADCAGPVPLGAVNGLLPASALCPLRSAPGHRLAAAAAPAFDAMSAAYRAAFGNGICVTDSYRDYATQVRVFAEKPALAATPGRSQHGWGLAVDLCGGAQNYGTAAYAWLKEHSTEYGFVHPAWAEPDGSRPEPWHWEYEPDSAS